MQATCTTPAISSCDSIVQPKSSSTRTRSFMTVEAVPEVVEHLVLRRQVRAILPESPFDVPGGEHAVWLVQSHVRVGVDPHAADAFPAVDQDDPLIAGQIAAGYEEGVDSGEAGSHYADIAALYGCVVRVTADG